MNTIYVDTYYLVVSMWFNMVQQVFVTWSNWNWSKEYTPFGPNDNHLDQSKVQWSKWFGPRNTLTLLPDSWLAARTADLTPDLQVCLSWGLIAESFHSLQSLSVSCFHVILGLPGPRFPSTCMWKAVFTVPMEHSTPAEPSLLQNEVQILNAKPHK